MEWILREAPDDWESLVPDGMPKILGRLLAQRGVEAESVERFLRPKLAQLSDPFEIAEMDLAVERVLLAVDAGEEVCIYGDTIRTTDSPHLMVIHHDRFDPLLRQLINGIV